MTYGFLIMLLIVFGINCCIHLFYKTKYKQLLVEIEGREFVIIKDVETKIRTRAYLAISWRKTISDIILVNGDIVIVPNNYAFGGIIKQKQPIIQLVSTWKKGKYNAVSSLHFVKQKQIKELDIKFILAPRTALEIDTTITFEFDRNTEEQRRVYDYLEFIMS